VKVTQTSLPGVLLIEPRVFSDERGFLLETFSSQRYAEAGMNSPNVQDNFVRSRRGVLRGLHYQEPHAQGKLIQVLRGEIFDVCVDIRRGSPTFGRWLGMQLTENEHLQMWIPVGFAHGFCVTSESADVYYKLSDARVPASERAILWSDPAIGIEWPVQQPILSAKDTQAPTLANATMLPNYS
jgi:dTDP-4-dehydrorhamnose 3,5-epimerase